MKTSRKKSRNSFRNKQILFFICLFLKCDSFDLSDSFDLTVNIRTINSPLSNNNYYLDFKFLFNKYLA